MHRILAGVREHSLLVFGIAGVLVVSVLCLWQINRAARMTTSTHNPSLAPIGQASTATNEKPDPGKLERAVPFPGENTKLAFVRDDTVHLYDFSTKAVRRIGEGYDPEISPKGDAITFTVNLDDPGSNTTIKLFRLSSHAISEFQSLSGLNVRQARWSHDGSKIAFDVIVNDKSHIGLLDVRTGKWHDLTQELLSSSASGVYSHSWSPDDGSIICHDLRTIYEISLTGSVLKRIPIDSVVPRGEVASSVRFLYSPDKKALLFNGARQPDNTAIYLYSFADKKLQRLAPETMDATEPMWLSSGKEVLFSCRRNDSDNRTDLCRLTVADLRITTLMENASSGSYAPR